MPAKKDPKKTNTKTTKKATKKTTKKVLKDTINLDILPMINNDQIVLEWVKTHNLKNIDITIPKNKLITVTGVSGSWKSSLAFHTIYKEWQFRYIESLSSYLRQFFNLGARPDLDHSEGLSPAIAIEQNKSVGNSRSTVGTLTEIDDYLRLLFAKIGTIYSYGSGKPIKAQTVEQIIDTIKDGYMDQKIFLLKEAGEYEEQNEFNTFVKKNRNRVEKEKGFTRYLLVSDNPEFDPIEYFYLETPKVPEKFFPIKIFGIFDRVTVEEKKLSRLKEDIIKILSETKKFGVYKEGQNTQDITWMTDKNYCPDFNLAYPQFAPQHFSANRAEGACWSCHGIGEVLQVDLEKILDKESTVLKAILPWRDSNLGQSILQKLIAKYSIDALTQWKDLPDWFKHVIIEWDDELIRVSIAGKFVSMKYKGVEEILKEQYNKWMLTVDFQAMLGMEPCPSCHGHKLRKESLHVFLTVPKNTKTKKLFNAPAKDHTFYESVVDKQEKDHFLYNIAQLHKMPMSDLIIFLKAFQEYTEQPKILVDRILKPLLDRANTIEGLGLSYMTLHRRVKTLSGWEIQRLRLAKQLGNKLTWIIYVLDEPTIGLNDKEIVKVVSAIRKLQKMGNTILVVEHHDYFIKESDWVIEIGPGAGDFGGGVVFNGPYDEFIKSDSLTAQYINGDKKIEVEWNHKPSEKKIQIKKANKFNLQNIDVEFNLGSFTILTGHSGSGKTTLMYTTLYKFLQDKNKFVQSYIRLQMLKQWYTWQEIVAAPVMKKEEYMRYESVALEEFHKEIGVETIMGHENIHNVLYVNQSSIGKTPRSCPSTFVGVFDKIRELYAGTNDAKYLGFNAGYFSFNSKKGSCPECSGYGYKKVELQFLPDTYVPCELCKGSRYKPEILDIKWRGTNISEVLDMYIKDALTFFEDIDHIHEPLQLMVDIGLGYLKMGQPAHMLSGGESQRLKLVKHLLKSYKGHTLYFLDEPTVGLHSDDIWRLLNVLKVFLEKWDTILMIEHDETLLKFADKVIELDNGSLV